MIRQNQEKIKQNKQLPYLVSNVVEVLDLEPELEEDGSALDSSAKADKCAVIKTTQREVCHHSVCAWCYSHFQWTLMM